MSNYRRTRQPGGFFFFTVVTRNRYPWFADENNVDVLRSAFKQIMAERPFTLEAIVVLPDHLHCLWQLPIHDGDYSGRWREIKKKVTRHFVQCSNLGNGQSIWQKRFWEHCIRDERDFRNHMDYIHYNPVRHGLVNNPIDWPWSSFAHAMERGWYEKGWGVIEPENIVEMDFE